MAILTVAFLPGTGCIHHQTTVYKDVERVKVEFENDAAARNFYEALSKYPHRSGEESNTEFHLPIVFGHSRKVVSGSNGAFNTAVLTCDTNQDGTITESEARIYAQMRAAHPHK